MHRRKFAVAVVAAVALLAVLVLPSAAIAGHDRPASKGGASADLALSATAPEKVSEGDAFSIEYSIFNHGPNEATGVKLTSRFDSSKSGFVRGYGCTASGNIVTCSSDYGISAGSVWWPRIDFRAFTSGDNFVNTGTISAQTKDLDTSNNTSSVSVPVGFEYGCEDSVGFAIPPVTQWYPYPEEWYSCYHVSSSSSARNIRIELKPQSNFYGTLSAEIRSGPAGTLVARISDAFVAGQPVAGTTSTTGLLPAGSWSLVVSVPAVNTSITTPYGQRCVTSQGPCLPYMDPREFFVYAPLSQGTYGAVVTAA